MAVEPLRPGDPRDVGGHRLLGLLGTGGMGAVYLGRSPGGRRVAVKVIKERFTADAVFRARFRREVAAARRVTGTFTAPILDADPDARVPWLITAYLPGLTLREAVEAFGALPAAAVRVLAAGLGEALADIHRAGLAHRDLKPGNIMLTADGPRVIDFGIARPEDGTAITRVGALLGTPDFMSPEQAARGPAGPKSDVFSFGAVLVYAVTGRAPFRGDTRAATLRRVSRAQADLSGIGDDGLAELIAACLRRDPQERPSAVRLLEMLDRLGEHAPPPGPGTRWLPARLAEEIDRRAAEDRPKGRPSKAPYEGVPFADDGETLGTFPQEVGERSEPMAGGSPGPRRRTLVLSAPIALSAAAAVALLRACGTERPRADASRPPKTQPPPAPPPQGVVRWKTRVSGFYPEAVAVDGVVVAEGQEGEVSALDARTGEVIWRKRAGNGSHTVGDSVYLRNPIQPWLRVVEAASGDTRWIGSSLGVGALRMAVAGPVACFGYEDSVKAVDADDGASRWAANVSAETGIAADPRLVAAAGKTSLVGLDARTGRKRWTRPLDLANLMLSAFLVGDGLVFAGDRNGVLHALRADDGTPVWRKGRGPNWSDPSSLHLSGGVLYADGGHGGVVALDAATGRERWSRFLDADSGLALSGGTLFAACAGEKQTVYALNAADGRVLWTHKARIQKVIGPSPTRGATPGSAGGIVFVGTQEGNVEAVGPPRGGPRAGP